MADRPLPQPVREGVWLRDDMPPGSSWALFEVGPNLEGIYLSRLSARWGCALRIQDGDGNQVNLYRPREIRALAEALTKWATLASQDDDVLCVDASREASSGVE